MLVNTHHYVVAPCRDILSLRDVRVGRRRVVMHDKVPQAIVAALAANVSTVHGCADSNSCQQ